MKALLLSKWTTFGEEKGEKVARASFLRRLIASKSIVRYKFIGARTAKINYSSKLSTNALVRYVQSNGFFLV